MIRWYSLGKKGIAHGEFSEKKDAPQQRELIWYHCLKPTEEDLKVIEQVTDIPSDNLSVALEDEIHPYVEKESHVELVYRAPLYEDGDVVTSPLVVFLKDKMVVTLALDKLNVIHNLKRRLAASKSKYMLKHGGAHFIHNLLDEINDDFLKRIEKVTAIIDVFEKHDEERKNFGALYDASLTSAHFNQALLGNAEVLNIMRKLYHRTLRPEDREEFNDLYLEVRQLLDTEKIQRELITNLFTLQNVMANQKVEKKLQQLTILAIIIAVPTMISGLYGMNIDHLPFAHHAWSFWILGAFMLVAVLLLIPLFKLMDWL